MSEIIVEILDHISGGKHYDYADIEAYLLRNHPEWNTIFTDTEVRDAVASFLRSHDSSGAEKANDALKAIGFCPENEY